jgi:hypothetical protein
MTTVQEIYDALHARQKELIASVNSHPQRSVPAFQIEVLSQQIANLNGAVSLLLKALGAKTYE